MTDERSKTPTIKTLPEAPKAKVGPRVTVPDVPPLAKRPPAGQGPTLVDGPRAKGGPARDSMDDASTHVFDAGNFRHDVPIETSDETSETYHRIDPAEMVPINAALPGQAKIASQSMKDDGTFKQEVATPIRVMSMKTPGVGDAAPRQDTPPRALPQVKLRAISDVAHVGHARPENLGYLAPPRDAREVRSRRTQDFVIWASVCVMIACLIALGIWFLGR
jgi:hypothetical protein